MSYKQQKKTSELMAKYRVVLKVVKDGESKKDVGKIFSMHRNSVRNIVAENIKKAIRHYLEQNIAHRIHSLLRKEGEEILEKMQISTLQQLHDAYEIIGEKKEIPSLGQEISMDDLLG